MTSKLKITLALAAVLAVTASVGMATGAIPSTNDGSINTCIATFNGTKYLRPIDKQAGEKCKTGEKPLTWNQKGVPGPQGPRGATGPAGPKGSGLGKITTVSSTESIDPGLGQVNTKCPAGTRVIGGGFSLGHIGTEDIEVTTSHLDPDGNQWIVEAVNRTSDSELVQTQAICVS